MGPLYDSVSQKNDAGGSHITNHFWLDDSSLGSDNTR